MGITWGWILESTPPLLLRHVLDHNKWQGVSHVFSIECLASAATSCLYHQAAVSSSQAKGTFVHVSGQGSHRYRETVKRINDNCIC